VTKNAEQFTGGPQKLTFVTQRKLADEVIQKMRALALQQINLKSAIDELVMAP
jgi:hypothetical protein